MKTLLHYFHSNKLDDKNTYQIFRILQQQFRSLFLLVNE